MYGFPLMLNGLRCCLFATLPMFIKNSFMIPSSGDICMVYLSFSVASFSPWPISVLSVGCPVMMIVFPPFSGDAFYDGFEDSLSKLLGCRVDLEFILVVSWLVFKLFPVSLLEVPSIVDWVGLVITASKLIHSLLRSFKYQVILRSNSEFCIYNASTSSNLASVILFNLKYPLLTKLMCLTSQLGGPLGSNPPFSNRAWNRLWRSCDIVFGLECLKKKKLFLCSKAQVLINS